METKLVVKIDELKIEGYNSDYSHLLDEVDTESYKEVSQLDITFFLSSLDELDTVVGDLEKIIIETSLKIVEIEEEQEDETVPVNKIGELHSYYASETV